MSESTWKEGVIRTAADETIAAPFMRLDDLLKTRAGSAASVFRRPPDHTTVGLGPVRIGRYQCYLSEYFVRGRLEEVRLQVDERDVFGTVATDSDSVKAVVSALRSWLLDETGKESPASYSWGSIAAIFDNKGGLSLHRIRVRTEWTVLVST